MTAARSLHQCYRALVDAIERDCRVAEWRVGDVDLWPLARNDLFLDMFRRAGGDTAPAPPPFAARATITLATPALNLWRSRHDLAHRAARPRRADAVLLGDGVSLDRIDDAWCDRYGEPIIAALRRRRRSCFVMQPGNLTRLPWVRPTFAANTIAARGAIEAALRGGPAADLPDHARVIDALAQSGVVAPSLGLARLIRRARLTAAHAAAFDRILCRVRPRIAFVVTYYAGLGHAFALACRRRGILCIDIQHCPHDAGAARAYCWPRVPPQGYSTLPGLFWTWSASEAADIQGWADPLARPWHRAIAGGHTQIAALGGGEGERLWRQALAATNDGTRPDRNILVALQPIGGRRELWTALAAQIEASPPDWRWWIRRHPASTPAQDSDYARLLALRRADVVIDAAAHLPLPALLENMSALVSLASGAAAEAALFGVPAFFLDDEALDTFPGLIARGAAMRIDVGSLLATIAALPARPPRRSIESIPPIDETIDEIDRIAADYAALCRDSWVNVTAAPPH